MTKGVDLSAWNGDIDFKRVKASGIDFAILREGYRKAIDSRFLEYVKGAQATGIEVLGVYHFVYVDGATIAENAKATIGNMRAAGLNLADTWVFVDIEYDTWTKAGIAVSKSKCTAYAKEYLDALRAAGCRKLGIYLNLDYHRNYYDWAQLDGYPLWLADYSGGPDIDCMIQQTSGTGHVDGIIGNVDLDTIIDSEAVGGKTMGKKCTAAQAVKAFEYWLGYREKATSAYSSTRDRSAFEKNAGAGNYTYAGTLCGCNGQPWCAAQVSLSVYEACGNDKALAKQVLHGVWPYTACNQLYDAAPSGMKGRRGAWTPKAGDVIVFSDNGSTRTHTGMVYAADAKYVYTIEGNSNNRVQKRSYLLTSGYVWGYVRPNYADAAEGDTTPTTGEQYGAAIAGVVLHQLSKGCAGPEVKAVQRILYSYGITGSGGKAIAVDGDFGKDTQYAVRTLQAKLKVTADGVVGEKTWAAMLTELW